MKTILWIGDEEKWSDASTTHWTTIGDNDKEWSDPSNWSSGTVPTESDHVVIRTTKV